MLLIGQEVSAHVLPPMKTLVVGRLVDPGSEGHTRDRARHQSALYGLTGQPLRP